MEHEYAFDCTLLATLRVRSTSRKAAAKLLSDLIFRECDAVQFGSMPTCSVSLESDAELVEIDGEAV